MVVEKMKVFEALKGLGFGVGFSGFPARWYYHFVFLRYRIAKPLGV